MPAKKTKKAKKAKTSRPRKPSPQDRPACGLCGNTKNLTRTECCGNWICDDEHEYALFSYARNSCYRNHDRFTLCAAHYHEGHEGRWQDCADCREMCETEMYVWLGTNEYNFEVLENPPAYEPTRCDGCGRVIVLSEGGYSQSSEGRFCGECTAKRHGGKLPDFRRLQQQPDPQEPPAPEDAERPPLRLVSDEDEPEGPATLEELVREVPPAYRDRYREIVRLTDAFCDEHLDDEYKQFSRELAVEVCQTDSPALKGKPESWAAGVVYALGRVNFLDDPSQTPHMKSAEVAKGFGISTGTMQAKARTIMESLDLVPLEPAWTLPSRLEDNPMVWMVLVNGVAMDIRTAPREVQVAAYEQGVIPYIPADRPK